MASQPQTRPIAIAPGPPNADDNGDAARPGMPYTCQTCAKRKVKCDKAAPTCSTCRKSRLECIYEAPRPRARKRKLSDEVFERLARYERILRQHGLLELAGDMPGTADDPASQEPISLLWDEPESLKAGKIMSCEGKSKYLYLNSRLWQNLQEHQVQSDSDEEGEEGSPIHTDLSSPSDPLAGAFVGSSHLNLLQYHPTHTEAMLLWETHVENVEPLCKILHIPSTRTMVERVSKEPATASKVDECLLFAIYHFALLSMTDEDCHSKLRQPRAPLLQQYHSAAKQALINASFLKTTEFPVLQALVLFLLASRNHYDWPTYWALTGAAVRVAQRLGVHRDGRKLGLPPFEVEMRRRLFYQLMPLDARASQMAGMGISLLPEAWDAQPPLNVDDDRLWPGMVEMPVEQKGATDMMFCLSRVCLGAFVVKQAKMGNGGTSGAGQFTDLSEAEQVVDRAESEVEEKYIRYCDVVNPLHFLAICMARSGVTAMRLRIRLPKAMGPVAPDTEIREVFQLAVKILDADAAVCGHTGLKKYRWHTEGFFMWGTWDSFVFVLTSLLKRGSIFTSSEVDAVWDKVEAMYRHHDELFESRRALNVALGRLAFKAWEARPPSRTGSVMGEPGFIMSLRLVGDREPTSRVKDKEGSEDISPHEDLNAGLPAGISPDGNLSLSSMFGGTSPASGAGFDVDAADWAFWDQLIQDHDALRAQ
ncbi:fungal-specific transcription factor domain-containing protein [Parachaetomium inaequale]|uniref:Fungal-specific transcription factor domain-containing protein n=1 Tax=Parachaetomium inaequale TaxID=2588326 RepID=A0AAN6SPV8_9PEZI|nr:fungal-specific transcription factor domain-containing protein [Parachaetomium inaequale]